MMNLSPRSGYATLGLLVVALGSICSSGVQAFHQAGWWRGGRRLNHQVAKVSAAKQQQLDLPHGTCRRRKWELHASAKNKSADPSVPSKKSSSNSSSNSGGESGGGGKRPKVSVKQAMQQWSADSLDLRRLKYKRVYVCKATTLPDVLSEFWSLTADCAQANYQAISDDRDYAAHVLFVIPHCDLLKDYGMMRHLDKVVDFCSGGCTDFGRTVTMQHYHPDFVLPPSASSQDGKKERRNHGRAHDSTTVHPTDLARVVNLSRSPFPAFGLTVAGGNAARSDPTQLGDKTGRFRLDLEMLYNSVSGCSTDDDVDAHGSEHGTIPSEPHVVMDKTQKWLAGCAEALEGSGGDEAERDSYGRSLNSAGGFVMTSFTTAEESTPLVKDLGDSEAWTNYRCRKFDLLRLMHALKFPNEIVCQNSTRYPGYTTFILPVFSEAWSIVRDLQARVAPAVTNETNIGKSFSASKPSCSTSQGQQEAHHGGAAAAATGGGAKEERVVRDEPLAATLLVAPRVHPFNAALFENLSLNLAIALKQTPIMDHIEVEVYHPEYVCDSGNIDPIRRSPFPTLLIKHCGLKDQLFEPSGTYRHAVPPIQIPLEALEAAAATGDGDELLEDGETATEMSADDVQL